MWGVCVYKYFIAIIIISRCWVKIKFKIWKKISAGKIHLTLLKLNLALFPLSLFDHFSRFFLLHWHLTCVSPEFLNDKSINQLERNIHSEYRECVNSVFFSYLHESNYHNILGNNKTTKRDCKQKIMGQIKWKLDQYFFILFYLSIHSFIHSLMSFICLFYFIIELYIMEHDFSNFLLLLLLFFVDKQVFQDNIEQCYLDQLLLIPYH